MTKRLIGIAIASAIALSAGCLPDKSRDPLDFPGEPGGKTDSLGRGLVGVASDYEAEELDEAELDADMRKRRDAAWATVLKVLEPVPLLGLAESADENEEIELADGSEVPKVARWQTWYGVSDLKRMFQHLYDEIGPSGRVVNAPFGSAAVEEAFQWNAKALERTSSWPLERYFKYVRSLGFCDEGLTDEECVALVETKFAGAATGNARILYSPAVATRVLSDYGPMLGCLDTLEGLAMNAEPASEDNFTTCFASEFAPNSVLVKAQWQRADFGRGMPAHDTDGDAMRLRLAQTAQWADEGNREEQPDPTEVFTIRLRNGDTYRLAGLHIMTKELRHWQWITMWWSDKPGSDFGADRPANFKEAVSPVWGNYKMCVVGNYQEGDAEAKSRFEDIPTLADAIDATTMQSGSSWCSNPYIEHGRNNASSNCIGCHQHGGATVAFDLTGDEVLDAFELEAVLENETLFPDRGRQRIRDVFPADYLYSFNRVDDFVHVIEGEVSFWDGIDKGNVFVRTTEILALAGDATAGELLFLGNCAACHGPEGGGTSRAPDLGERVPTRDDDSLLRTLIAGRGDMPAWGGDFSNQELADLRAFLRASFGGGDD